VVVQVPQVVAVAVISIKLRHFSTPKN